MKPVDQSLAPTGISSTPRSVLIVGPVPPPYGGMAVQARALERQLRTDGISTELMPTNPKLPFFFARIKGVRSVIQTTVFTYNLVRALRRATVVHLLGASFWYFFLRVVPTVLLARLFRCEVILNYRGGEAPVFFARYYWLVRPVIRLAQFVAVPSAYLERLFKEYGFHPQIIPNFVDLEQFRFTPRQTVKPHLLVARGLEPLYNIKMALESFRLVQKQYPDAHIDIIGGGSQEAELKRWVAAEGLNGVVFHGSIANEEMPKYLERADILLNPSNADNMPINLLEAFACGIPIVSTRVGGIPDLVESEEAALLVEPGDYKSMAAKVEELLSQPEKVKKLTENAKSICDRYKWSSVRALWFKLYGVEANSYLVS